MNGHPDFEEIQLLGYTATPINVDKELITVFAGALVVVLGILVTVIKIFLRNQAEAIEKIARSTEKVGDTLAGAVREQTVAQTNGANETRQVLTELQLATSRTQMKLSELVRVAVNQESELKSLHASIRDHDSFAKASISELKRERLEK